MQKNKTKKEEMVKYPKNVSYKQYLYKLSQKLASPLATNFTDDLSKC